MGKDHIRLQFRNMFACQSRDLLRTGENGEAFHQQLSLIHISLQLMQSIYAFVPQRVVVDAHPGYRSTQWAASLPLPLETVLHHHAPVSYTHLDVYKRQPPIWA